MPEYRHSHTKAVRSVEEGSDDERLLLTDPRWQLCPPALTAEGEPAAVVESRVSTVVDDLADIDDLAALLAIAEAEGHDVDKRLKDLDKVRDAIRLARRT